MAFFPIPKTKRYTIIKMAHFPVSFLLSSFMNQVLYETVLFSLVIPHLIIMPYFSFSTIQYLFIRASLCKYQSFKCEYLMNLNFHTPPKIGLLMKKQDSREKSLKAVTLYSFRQEHLAKQSKSVVECLWWSSRLVRYFSWSSLELSMCLEILSSYRIFSIRE